MEDQGYYYVKNWWKYQHYRDRTPPWIKVHRRVLSNEAFLSLSPSDRWYLIRLWIDASEHDGTIPARSGYVRATCGLGSDYQASCLLARLEGKHLISLKDVRGAQRVVASVETETEKETYKQEKTKARAAKIASFDLPDWVPEESWSQYLNMRRRIKKPMTDYAMKLAIRELEKLKQRGNDPRQVLDQSVMHSWQGLFELRNGGSGGDSLEDYVERVERERAQKGQSA